ncbi:phage tail assembly protein [Rhizobium sp. 1AS11]|uniref:phage tail assembly protein n=1 Tax=Rhizobium acaciae TaxID=2989736 RepID=UPI0022230FE8|nr:phage tail assembly protein [Rhizobium acaciae]MCW1412217.1 phage tail assembly protein [Rhizobium acaciae]MCW1744232.1 phage tail assembly protein [Rhizobium acaciae]
MTDIRKTTSLPLAESVTIEGREITVLNFRRMKGKDIKAVEKLSNIDATAHLICELSGNPPELFDEMDAADIDAASKIVEGFMKRKAR